MSSPGDPHRSARLQALVEQGRALPLGARTAFLARAAPDDASLRAEAQALLDAESRDGPGRPLAASSSPSVPPGPPAVARPGLEPGEPDLAARRLGDCTLTRRLAGGGMGVVYEAIQDPPGRTVAVKVLRAALAGEEGRVRFAHEARVLARLQHPGIAQIYETGTTTSDTGEALPYFVMEHVPGAQTLLEHTTSHGLGTKERVALFIRVCDAVHFGHTKGVIHRDLKPGNVLVDAEGAPKVIDFGIARSTVAEADHHETPHTQTGLLVGTLPYMSPEQVAGRREDVDTRSDVYALGVILYELLTGRLPYDLENVGVVEAARRIATAPPLPPQRFAPDTQGDLAVVIGKALAKDPAQRYASAEALGQDLSNYLSFTPIQARPPSLAYQVKLFARRHRAAFAASTVGVLALVGAAIVSAWFATSEARERQEAERQKQRAEALLERTRTLVPWLLGDFNREIAGLPGSVTPRSSLAGHLKEHLDALAVTERDHPSVLDAAVEARGALADVLGGAGGGNLGRREEAEAQFGAALVLLARREAQGADPVKTALVRAKLLVGRAGARKELGKKVEAMQDLEAGIAALEGSGATSTPAGAEVDVELRTRRADLEWDTGRYAPALEVYRDVLARWDSPALANVPETTRARGRALAHLALAQCLLEMRMPTEAQPHLEAVAAAAAAIEALPSPSPSDLTLLYYLHDNVGRAYLETDRYDEAMARFDAALSAAQRRLAHDPADAQGKVQVHNAYMLLGNTAFERGRDADALQHFAQALELSDQLAMNEPATSNVMWDRRLALTQSGVAEMRSGRYGAAAARLSSALSLAEARVAALPDEESFLGLRDVLSAQSNLAIRGFRGALSAAGMVAAAGDLAAAAGAPPLGPWLLARARLVARQQLARAEERLGRAREALVRCRSLPGWGEGHERDLARTDASLANMAEVLKELGK